MEDCNNGFKINLKREQSFYRKRYKCFLFGWLYGHQSFMLGRYLLHYRCAQYLSNKCGVIKKTKMLYHRRMMNKYSYKIGCQFGINSLDWGVRIFHFGDMIINDGARIGKNLTIYPGVTVGQTAGNPLNCPIIGDNVFIYQNAMVCGKIKIGNNVVILANSVVTHDVPDNVIVGGIPAKIIMKNI